MVKLRFLTLANYRGIKDKKINLAGNKVSVYGKNGAGKTTVANAVMDILADSNVTGEKDYSPKTEGTHKLNHTAELGLSVDGEESTYGKDFHEIWKKKRGSTTSEFSGHETTYTIDGMPVRRKDYIDSVTALCHGDSEMIKMLMIPGYFAEELPMDKRRKLLVDICGDISDDDILNLSGIAPLRDYLDIPSSNKKYTPEDYIVIAKTKRRDLNKKLDEIPARIDEISRTIGSIINVDEVKVKLETLNKEKRDLLAKPRNTAILGIEAAIAGIRTAIAKGREEWAKQGASEIDAKLALSRKKKNSIIAEIDRLSREADSKISQIERMQNEREKCLDEFDKLKAEKWDSASEICPTCGQVLPEDKIKEMRENWLANLANRKAEINERGRKVSLGNINKVKDEYAALTGKLASLSAELDAIKKENADASENRNVYEKSEKYKENKMRLDELQDKLEKAKAENPETEPDTSEIDAKINALNEEMARYNAQEAARNRVDELQAEMHQASEKIDYYDRGISLCEAFFKAKMDAVSERVSEHFNTVGWRLFKTQINGGLQECCEPLVRNDAGMLVEWKSANTSGQINAGLEIIDVLSKHFDTYLPVLVDRAESVTNLREMPAHQVIRFIVSEEYDALHVVNED